MVNLASNYTLQKNISIKFIKTNKLKTKKQKYLKIIRSCFQVFVTSFQFGELTKTISNKFIKTNKDRETKVLKNNG